MPNNSDRFKSFLVIIATGGVIALNWLAAGGYLNGMTPETVSGKYPTLITPAGYAFAIWNLIYFALAVFSIYQALPKKAERFRGIGSLYILSCAANCAWVYFRCQDQILVSLFMILALLTALLLICIKLRNTETNAEFWLAKAPFGIYFGWVTAAAMIDVVAVLKYTAMPTIASFEITLSTALILLAAVLGVIARIKLSDYFYPLAMAWAVTAIAVAQSSHVSIVIAAAVACIVSLFTALSFVLSQNGRPQQPG